MTVHTVMTSNRAGYRMTALNTTLPLLLSTLLLPVTVGYGSSKQREEAKPAVWHQTVYTPLRDGNGKQSLRHSETGKDKPAVSNLPRENDNPKKTRHGERGEEKAEVWHRPDDLLVSYSINNHAEREEGETEVWHRLGDGNGGQDREGGNSVPVGHRPEDIQLREGNRKKKTRHAAREVDDTVVWHRPEDIRPRDGGSKPTPRHAAREEDTTALRHRPEDVHLRDGGTQPTPRPSAREVDGTEVWHRPEDGSGQHEREEDNPVVWHRPEDVHLRDGSGQHVREEDNPVVWNRPEDVHLRDGSGQHEREEDNPVVWHRPEDVQLRDGGTQPTPRPSAREVDRTEVWHRAGDLQLGVVLSLTAFHPQALCGPRLRRPSALHRLHAIVFAIEEINRRQDLLPNITLGFVVMDDCSRDAAALLRSLHFIPRPACSRTGSSSATSSAGHAPSAPASCASPSSSPAVVRDGGGPAAAAASSSFSSAFKLSGKNSSWLNGYHGSALTALGVNGSGNDFWKRSKGSAASIGVSALVSDGSWPSSDDSFTTSSGNTSTSSNTIRKSKGRGEVSKGRGNATKTSEGRGDATEEGRSQMESYRVVGVLGAELSESSMQMAALLSAFRVPQLSYASSSPFLSDKNKYGFFSRIVPSDRQQAEVIVDLLEQLHWTYVAAVFSYDVYGLSGYRYIRGLIRTKGICLAEAIATESEFDADDYLTVVRSLVAVRPPVRAVVLFTIHANSVLRAAQTLGLGGRFLWLSSDALVPNVHDFEGFEPVSLGLLLVGFTSGSVRRFEERFQYCALSNCSTDPWFPRFYQVMFNCSIPNNSSSSSSPASSTHPLPPCPLNVPLLRSPLFERNTSVMRAVNAVYTFAHALNNTIKDCPHDRANVSRCVAPEALLASLRETSFTGENDVTVAMDRQGDGVASYQVRNMRQVRGEYYFTTVGQWDGATRNFTFLHKRGIVWHPDLLKHGKHRKGQGDGVRTGQEEEEVEDDKKEGEEESVEEDGPECSSPDDCVPTSTCRERCGVGQQAMPTWPRCCWVCKACRENEYTADHDGMPTCHPCPSEGNFSWPDPATRTTCLPIPPTAVTFRSALGVTLMTFDLLVLALVAACCVLYVRYRDRRLIRATSRELSALMLVGHMIACLAVPVFLLPPSAATCLLAHSAFHLSLTLVYAPLLVRINRIHRIFVSGRRSARKPPLIGSGFQLLVSLSVVLAHLSFIALLMTLQPPGRETRMPSPNHAYVEVVCSVSEKGFITSLGLNLALMAACALHALSTRHLPANYNEAKFIIICVYTIAVLWLSFLATYFLLDSGVVHTLCLALALLVNVTSCQAFLFLPKLYAVYKLPAAKLHVQREPVAEADRVLALFTLSHVPTAAGLDRVVHGLNAAQTSETSDESTLPTETADTNDVPTETADTNVVPTETTVTHFVQADKTAVTTVVHTELDTNTDLSSQS